MPTCACGCGQFLKPGAKQRYLRGHRSNPVAPADGMADYINEAMPEGAPEFGDESDEQFWAGSISLDDAAAMTPDDPQPNERVKEEKPEIRVTKRVRDDVEGKIGFMLMTTANLLSLFDPICGPSLLSQSDVIAQKMTPIICKSPDAVAWFRKSSNVMMYVDLCVACGPVLSTIFAHHLSGRKVHNITDATMPPMPPQEAYAA